MKSFTGYALTIIVTAAVFGILGWQLSRSDAEAKLRTLKSELEVLRMREETHEEALAQRRPAPREAPTEMAPDAPALAPSESGAAAALAAVGGAPETPTLTVEQRLARIREIGAAAPAWFDRGDGKAAIEALQELAALAPEGRVAAMELALKINEDVQGENRLKLGTMTWYTSLGAPAVKDLMVWSLENDSPSAFRQMSAYSLPWTQPVEVTVAQFRKALMKGQEVGVQQAMVWNLAQMRSPAAMETLSDLFNDVNQAPDLRARIAPELAVEGNEELARSLETAALSDPDPTVRRAAKAALVIINPPATGYLITGTLPQSQAAAAGITTGDILVSYAGKPTRNLDELRAAATGATGNEEVPVVVVRDGAEVTIYLRPGQMGIYGKDVKAR